MDEPTPPYDLEDNENWAEVIVRFWGCPALPERVGALSFVDLSPEPALFVPVDYVKALFNAAEITVTVGRWEIFVAHWQLTEVTVDIGDVPTQVFLRNRLWMFNLQQALFDGVIVEFPSQRCQQLDFSNLP